MKKVIRFSKTYKLFVALSALMVVSGIYAAMTKGINFGIDFRPGLVEEIRIAPPALKVVYKGTATVTLQPTAQALALVISGVGADNATHTFYYYEYPTIGKLVEGLNTVADVSASTLLDASTPSAGLFANSSSSSAVDAKGSVLHHTDSKLGTVEVEKFREALASFADISIKTIGDPADNNFQIRVGDDGTDPAASENLKSQISSSLAQAFGAENIAVTKTDFIGSQFSKSLATQSFLLFAATLLLIWLYATIRFKWDFALGAILALVHDVLFMMTFIAWSGMEFNSLTLAAILTIVGYSINDTIVVLDRVRDNIRILNVKTFTEIMDISQTEILSRTIITTLTTLLAVLSLYIFTSGSMKDFALALIMGMLSGVYSTIIITSAFVCLVRRNWKPSDELKKVPSGGSTSVQA